MPRHRTPHTIRPMTTDDYPSELTTEDLARIGEALLNAAATMASLGHESPSGLVDYVNRDAMPSWHAQFVLDMVAYSHGLVQDEMKNEALDRIHGLVWQTGWMHRLAEVVTR